MTVSDGALREGLLYDMLGRIRHEDVRDRSVDELVTRFKADSIKATPIDASIFQIAPTFKEVSFAQMMYEMEEIFKQFI
jgi:exopolyphosphatase/guanosine-5'-triphosphate,3'-diphosphate pyrophosphatase